MEKYKTKSQSCQNAVMRCCNLCQNFRHEEVGDSDFGAVYEATCSEYLDTDTEEEVIDGFDRTIERDCCDLDFFKVTEIDMDLSKKLKEEMDKTEGSFSNTYKIFCDRYNNAQQLVQLSKAIVINFVIGLYLLNLA